MQSMCTLFAATTLVAAAFAGEKLTQTTCFNEECTLSCRSHAFPLNQCLRAQGGLSAILACKEDVVEQQTFCGGSCAGDVAETKEIPQGVCVKGNQPGDYFKDSCLAEPNETTSMAVGTVTEELMAQMIFHHRKPSANGTWSQKVCSGNGCTEEDKCEVETYNQGQCYPVESGGSAIGECWACGVRLSIWAADGCPGAPSQVMTEPVGECAKQQGGSWAMNSCDSSSSLATGSAVKIQTSLTTTIASSTTTIASSTTALASSTTTTASSTTTTASSTTTIASSITTIASSTTTIASSTTPIASSTTPIASSTTPIAASTIVQADFSQLVCQDRKCSTACETESYTFNDCLPVVGGGSARGVSCCDNTDCVLQGSDFGLLLDVYRSDTCTGSSHRMKQPVTECDRTSSGDQKFAEFVCGGNSSVGVVVTEIHLQSTISV